MCVREHGGHQSGALRDITYCIYLRMYSLCSPCVLGRLGGCEAAGTCWSCPALISPWGPAWTLPVAAAEHCLREEHHSVQGETHNEQMRNLHVQQVGTSHSFLVRLDHFNLVGAHCVRDGSWCKRGTNIGSLSLTHFLCLTCTSCAEKTPGSAFAAPHNDASPGKSLEFFIVSDEGDCLSRQLHVNSSWLRRRQKSPGHSQCKYSSKIPSVLSRATQYQLHSRYLPPTHWLPLSLRVSLAPFKFSCKSCRSLRWVSQTCKRTQTHTKAALSGRTC